MVLFVPSPPPKTAILGGGRCFLELYSVLSVRLTWDWSMMQFNACLISPRNFESWKSKFLGNFETFQPKKLKKKVKIHFLKSFWMKYCFPWVEKMQNRSMVAMQAIPKIFRKFESRNSKFLQNLDSSHVRILENLTKNQCFFTTSRQTSAWFQWILISHVRIL